MKRERGSTALEMVVMAPLVLFVCLLFIQAGIAVWSITSTQTAARQGARALAQGNNPVTAVDGSLPGWLSSSVTTFGPGHGVRVTVDLPLLVPGASVEVNREAVMP